MFQYLSAIIDKPSSLPTVEGQDALKNGLMITFEIIGAIAFLVIVISGLLFVLSRGDPGGAARARNTIIFAVVGLVIAATASIIVQFTLGRTS